jgi:hypothetical protein
VSATVNVALVVAGCLSAIAAILHLAIIVQGAEWYRFFGAGEAMARAAAQGRLYPTLVTMGIATVLATWSAYAFSGAGLLPAMPWLRPALCAITAVYLLRGLVIVPALVMPRSAATGFWIWSSGICLVFGAAHLVGLVQRWDALGG